jgi:hypothetical protein
MLKLAWQELYLNHGEDDVKGPHAVGGKSTIDREASGSETGPKQAWVSQPRPADLVCSLSPVRDTLWPRCSLINCVFLWRPPHPSIHQRATDTKEKHREEAGGRRKSSSRLGDGIGHALAAMVVPMWWSHGGVPEPMPWFHQVNCTLCIRWWYKSCLFLNFSYFDACLIHMCS